MNKSLWLKLSGDQRKKIKDLFGIGLTENIEVVDSRVISDGIGDATLAEVFSEKNELLVKEVGKGEGVELFGKLVGKLFGEAEAQRLGFEIVKVEEEKEKVVKSAIKDKYVSNAPAKRGRPRKIA